MPSSCPSEERFPLLLLFLEDGQRSSKHRRILIDKNRYHGIASGATAVINQWPGHLTACWATAILIGLAIIIVSMMMFTISLRPGTHLLTSRCRNNHIYDKENRSTIIHLVHGTHPWLPEQLETLEKIADYYPQANVEVIVIQNEINFLNSTNVDNIMEEKKLNIDEKTEGIISTTDGNKENIITITTANKLQTGSLIKSSTTKNLKRVKRIKIFLKHKSKASDRRKRFYPWDKIQLNINIGTKKLLKMLLKQNDFEESLWANRRSRENALKMTSTTKTSKIQNIQELIKRYPNIHIKMSTYEDIFKHSPLYLSWQNTNEITRLFAIRVLQMWNFAGITFDLPEILQSTDNVNPQLTSPKVNTLDEPLSEEIIGKYEKLITVGLASFENLPEGLVTVDDEALHMETKTACHAFFGEMLINLRKSRRETMPVDIIKKALKTFCKRGAVDANYCKRIDS